MIALRIVYLVEGYKLPKFVYTGKDEIMRVMRLYCPT